MLWRKEKKVSICILLGTVDSVILSRLLFFSVLTSLYVKFREQSLSFLPFARIVKQIWTQSCEALHRRVGEDVNASKQTHMLMLPIGSGGLEEGREGAGITQLMVCS